MRGRRALPRDAGAAAVEFALVSVLLFTVLFGILQYGMLLWQLQGAQSTVQDIARSAARGVPSCVSTSLMTMANGMATANGLPANSVTRLDITYSDANPLKTAARDDTARVVITVRPTQLGLPFIPVPATLTPSTATLVEFAGACVNPIHAT